MTDQPNLVLFHTGYTVSDLGKAVSRFEAEFGLKFAAPADTLMQVRARDGSEQSRRGRIAISKQGPHHIELMQAFPNASDEMAAGGARLHHLGYWTSDLTTAAATLEAHGFQREMAGIMEGVCPWGFTFHSDPDGGMLTELLSEELYRAMLRYLDGQPLM
jgi:Glyoxalase/Bleomycin resistance protein/Dioxygenase superfamily